ncbi:MAG: hypothetical protein HQL97_16390 [Magnetococcales bacterium]|nr:hypothetical protein [Magnetococcales bacterium]
METTHATRSRLYFLLGDLLACGVLSALATWAAWLLPSTWPMSVEMVVGMGVGMVAAMLAMPPFLALFGALEVMIPVMLGSMASSMLPSMVPRLRDDLGMLLAWGAGCGLAAWGVTWLADRWLRRRVGRGS